MRLPRAAGCVVCFDPSGCWTWACWWCCGSAAVPDSMIRCCISTSRCRCAGKRCRRGRRRRRRSASSPHPRCCHSAVVVARALRPGGRTETAGRPWHCCRFGIHRLVGPGQGTGARPRVSDSNSGWWSRKRRCAIVLTALSRPAVAPGGASVRVASGAGIIGPTTPDTPPFGP